MCKTCSTPMNIPSAKPTITRLTNSAIDCACLKPHERAFFDQQKNDGDHPPNERHVAQQSRNVFLQPLGW